MNREGDIHVLPVDDLRKHDENRYCWCRPRVEEDEWTTDAVIIHNSLDGRELVEQHGLQ